MTETRTPESPMNVHQVRELKEQCEVRIRDMLQDFADTACVQIESVQCTIHESQTVDLGAIGSYRNSSGLICRQDVFRVKIRVTL